jgi:membrane protease YdiL (CAAX protease family)
METKKKRSFLERFTIAIYFTLTFIATIALGAANQFTNNAFISPQYAPAIGLVLICLITKDWSIWGKMNWNPFKRPKGMLWMLMSLLLPFAVILISSLIMSSLGNQFFPWQDTASGYVLIIFISILGCIFEEIGWRGYLLPKFAEKHTMFRSAIGVGLLWGVWHCKFAYGLMGFILFVVLIVCFSILMTWIYMKTNGNLLCMMSFHLGVNIGSAMLLRNREGALFYGLAAVICALICIPVVLKNKTEFFGKEKLEFGKSRAKI